MTTEDKFYIYTASLGLALVLILTFFGTKNVQGQVAETSTDEYFYPKPETPEKTYFDMNTTELVVSNIEKDDRIHDLNILLSKYAQLYDNCRFFGGDLYSRVQ